MPINIFIKFKSSDSYAELFLWMNFKLISGKTHKLRIVPLHKLLCLVQRNERIWKNAIVL
ncbi:hypothetical protein VT25_02495 [Photobacterium leiognathi subsp. mandapamensis]|nr:hypothetical protein VT25_02495 [Photobacterium leiognathi subsp. mandapamensis]